MAKTKITKTGTEATYKRFLAHVNLYALGLDSLHADIKREAYAIAHAESVSGVERLIKSQFLLIEFGEEQFDVQAHFSLRIKSRSLSREQPQMPPPEVGASIPEDEDLLCIKVNFTAHFHCQKMAGGKNYAERFAVSEARLIFWPYFRQVISDTTARMSVRPITVPLTFKP